MAQKRRAGGRTTPPRGAPPQAGQDKPPRTRRDSPEASARYTPRTPDYRTRPGWHRLAGWAAVALGVIIVVVNDIELVAKDVSITPGGHSELYLLLGVAVAVVGAWFLGAFDRGTTIYD